MNCICGCVVNLASCAVKKRVCSGPPSMRVRSVDYPAVLITIQLELVNLLKEKPRKKQHYYMLELITETVVTSQCFSLPPAV